MKKKREKNLFVYGLGGISSVGYNLVRSLHGIPLDEIRKVYYSSSNQDRLNETDKLLGKRTECEFRSVLRSDEGEVKKGLSDSNLLIVCADNNFSYRKKCREQRRGPDRLELGLRNYRIMKRIAYLTADLDDLLTLVVTNPVGFMTGILDDLKSDLRESYQPEKEDGQAVRRNIMGLMELDVIRAEERLGEILTEIVKRENKPGLKPDQVSIKVTGMHSGKAIPLLETVEILTVKNEIYNLGEYFKRFSCRRKLNEFFNYLKQELAEQGEKEFNILGATTPKTVEAIRKTIISYLLNETGITAIVKQTPAELPTKIRNALLKREEMKYKELMRKDIMMGREVLLTEQGEVEIKKDLISYPFSIQAYIETGYYYLVQQGKLSGLIKAEEEQEGGAGWKRRERRTGIEAAEEKIQVEMEKLLEESKGILKEYKKARGSSVSRYELSREKEKSRKRIGRRVDSIRGLKQKRSLLEVCLVETDNWFTKDIIKEILEEINYWEQKDMEWAREKGNNLKERRDADQMEIRKNPHNFVGFKRKVFRNRKRGDRIRLDELIAVVEAWQSKDEEA